MSRSSASAGLPHLIALDLVRERRDELVVHARADDDAAGRGAVLAGVPVARALEDLGRELDVGVVEHDHRRLAAELEVEPLDGARPRAPRCACRSTVSPVIETIRTLGCATSMSPIAAPEPDSTLRTPAGSCVRDELREPERGQRRPGRRLEDDRVAGRERRAELPGRHVQRVVPGRDRGDDADRVAADHRRVAVEVLGDREALHDAAGAREEPEQVRARGHLVDGGADRLAASGWTRGGRARRRSRRGCRRS